MSVAGISSSNFYDYGSQSVQNKMQQVQKEFQQLGQDLQSGNISAAQSDFATLQQLGPQGSSTSSSSTSSSTSSSQSSNPVAQAFSQLSTDLQSGNLSAAQQDYTTIQQDLQNQGAQGHHHHHHHASSGSSGSEGNTVGQAFSQLGQALQSGNLSAAQQAYSTLQTDFQQFAQNNGVFSTPTSSASSSSGISVSA